jgi:hypothetical protein
MKISCADAITLITGKLFCSVDRLYTLYNELTGDNLYTHQLPRAYHACAPSVRKELPDLTASLRATYQADENFSEFSGFSPKWEKVLSNAREVFGNEFEVTPIADWEHIHPLEELTRKVGTDKIIVIEP